VTDLCFIAFTAAAAPAANEGLCGGAENDGHENAGHKIATHEDNGPNDKT